MWYTLMAITGMFLSLMAQPGGNKKDLRREGALKAGDLATDFTLMDVEGKKSVKLSELKGKPVVLIFGSCT